MFKKINPSVGNEYRRYRDAGAEVAAVFASFSDFVERASVDEAFIDLTTLVEQRIRSERITLDPEKFPTTFVVGYSDKKSNDMGKGWFLRFDGNLDF